MKTDYIVYRTDGTTTEASCELAEHPGLDAINAVVRPLIGTLLTKYDHLEHVAVMIDGERRDLFVDEDGQAKRLERNEAATTHYRRSWLTAYPKTDPETLPYIYGDAVLFGRRIWF
jgi:hypothetical protein